jgi:peroxiredoxin
LRRFEAMRPDLAAEGVTMIALSKDDVPTAARHRERDGLGFAVLADPELKVIRQFGVEHHKAVEFSKGGFVLLGVPLAAMMSFRTMAIPTTLLIDEQGIIRWLDQADDYRLRSAPQRVLDAVRTHLGSAVSSRHGQPADDVP